MHRHLRTLAIASAISTIGASADAQFATLPTEAGPMVFSQAECRALTEIRNAVSTRSADDIERIGAAMEANRYADPVEVARISGLSVPTVTTIGALDQQQGMAVSLVYGSMLRYYHPDLLMKVLRDRGALGQVPDVAGNPFGMAVLDGLMTTAQQGYLTQCT